MIFSVLQEPVLTEKAVQQAKTGVYTFMVAPSATKHTVKDAVEKTFHVKVSHVRVATRLGEERRVGRKGLTKRTQQGKIAYVTVKTGKISVFPEN